MIDIGGHSLIRAAAKNYFNSTILVDPLDYPNFMNRFPETVSAKKKYAIKAMKHITKYDISITKFILG